MQKKGTSRRGMFGTVSYYDSKGKKSAYSNPGLFDSWTHYDK